MNSNTKDNSNTKYTKDAKEKNKRFNANLANERIVRIRKNINTEHTESTEKKWDVDDTDFRRLNIIDITLKKSREEKNDR
jgi:hypothetical protein